MESMETKSEVTPSKTRHWKSLEEFHNDPHLAKTFENEFMSTPAADDPDANGGVARRDFLKLMSAALAMTSTACIRRPVQRIVPYSKAPPEIVPGVANYYSSSYAYAGEGFGLVVKTREGRPLKLEGNTSHPLNQGGLTARAHAHLLGVYDPDRASHPLKVARQGEASKTSWETLDKAVVEKLTEGGVVLLTSSLSSPSTAAVVGDFVQAFGARHVSYDAVGADDVIAGQSASYGTAVLPRYRFDQAKLIVSIEGDFLGTWLQPAAFAKQFSKTRKPGSEMSRLVTFESLMSLTGANSDIRLRILPGQAAGVAMGLAHEIVVKQGKSRYAGDGAVKSALSGFADVAQQIGAEPALFSEIAKDLWEARGASLVLGGGISSRTSQGLSLQIAVNFLNSVLENDGKTIDSSTPLRSHSGSYRAMAELIADMKAGKVKTLILHRTNPVYTLPSDSGFTEALAKVGTVVSLNDRVDETSVLADWLAPDHHDVENWDDHELIEGVYSIQQPTIRPLGNTRAMQQSLMSWAQQAKKGPARLLGQESWYGYLKEQWKGLHSRSGKGGGFEKFWVASLHEGVLDLSQSKRSNATGARGFRVTALQEVSVADFKKANGSGALHLVLYPTVQMGDGHLSNVAWLQELPDPITKCVWDSYVTLSPAKAKELGVDRKSWGDGDTEEFSPVVSLTVGNETLKLPVHVQPGQADATVGLALGYGRTRAGRVGNGIGVNAWRLAKFNAGVPVFAGLTAQIAKTGEKYDLANTQGHQKMEGRQIVVEATLAEYLKKKDANIHRHHVMTIWPQYDYKGHKWAMAIDQNSCIGCSACVVACMSENNIPVVGKKYVLRGREMHWIRIDRYYSGSDVNNPDVVFQPMLCQHCENAPCETVCPVLATVHSSEGLNEMVYNRCVGTRYCSNNCPYKVRRYNWFNYAKEDNNYHMISKPKNAALNPEVTVRTRGVMEKCTFCVQRIHVAKNEARDQGRALKDGDVVTACEQSCPTDAIVFGDLNDSQSRVAKIYQDERSYSVLEEYNTRPRVRYQTKIRNNKKTGAGHDGSAHHAELSKELTTGGEA